MSYKLKNILKTKFGINENILNIAENVEMGLINQFKKIDKIKEYNQYKVIDAMQSNHLSDSHFAGTTGYGYGDRGREVLDAVYSGVFNTEHALVRHQMVSGTHALALCMFGLLRPGDELLAITGDPYDTLKEVIGIRGEGAGSLKDFGISYKQVDLLEGKINSDEVEKSLNRKTKLILIQRSRGYAWRPSIQIDDIEKIIKTIKNIRNDIFVMVDNCYGEFVEEKEPTDVGADIVAGSLIKNPGGGLVPTGGYIVGTKYCVEKAANRLTTPGLGGKVGSTLGNNRLMFQGLFMAPHVVAESLKGAVFCASIMQKLGFEISPLSEEKRGDIIQAIKFKDSESLILFCQGIQKAAPVDSFVTPLPWDMPGYDSPILMAAGTFIQGSSIELSADAPIKPPYIGYIQGGLVYEHVKLGIITSIQLMMNKGLINKDIIA